MSTESTLTNEQINRAAWNDAVEHFTLGGREFKIVDLPYDDYTRFLSYIAPLMEHIVKKMVLSQAAGLALPDGIALEPTSFTAFDLLKVCTDNLPQMAQLVCKQTDPFITVEDVKKLAGKPMPLADIIIRQIVQNGMIGDFKDFFERMISMLKAMR